MFTKQARKPLVLLAFCFKMRKLKYNSGFAVRKGCGIVFDMEQRLKHLFIIEMFMACSCKSTKVRIKYGGDTFKKLLFLMGTNSLHPAIIQPKQCNERYNESKYNPSGRQKAGGDLYPPAPAAPAFLPHRNIAKFLQYGKYSCDACPMFCGRNARRIAHTGFLAGP